MSDSVKNPKHYQLIGDTQAIHVIARSMTGEQWFGYCQGNLMKYRLRAGNKGDPQECLAKADQYAELHEKYKHLCFDA